MQSRSCRGNVRSELSRLRRRGRVFSSFKCMFALVLLDSFVQSVLASHDELRSKGLLPRKLPLSWRQHATSEGLQSARKMSCAGEAWDQRLHTGLQHLDPADPECMDICWSTGRSAHTAITRMTNAAYSCTYASLSWRLRILALADAEVGSIGTTEAEGRTPLTT